MLGGLRFTSSLLLPIMRSRFRIGIMIRFNVYIMVVIMTKIRIDVYNYK